MAFNPVSAHALREPGGRVSHQREFRLYQASFLLRDYGWNVEDLPFQPDTNLPLDDDPKLAWAEENLRDAPVEVNRATRGELLRVPGIGPKTADAILHERRRQRIRETGHLRALGMRDVQKAGPYMLLDGKLAEQQLSLF